KLAPAVTKKEGADYTSARGDCNGIPKSSVDVPCAGGKSGRNKGQEAAEYAIADMIWKGERSVPHPGRKELHEKGCNRAIHHRDIQHQGKQNRERGRIVNSSAVHAAKLKDGIARIICLGLAIHLLPIQTGIAGNKQCCLQTLVDRALVV